MASSFNNSPRGSRSSASQKVSLICQGMTAGGRNCRRTVEYDLAGKQEPDWASPEVYCHDHQHQAPDYDPAYASPRPKRKTKNITSSQSASQDTYEYSASVRVHVEMTSQSQHRVPKTKTSRSNFKPSSSDEEDVDLEYLDQDGFVVDDSTSDEDSASPRPNRHAAKSKVAKSSRPAAKTKPPRSSAKPVPSHENPPVAQSSFQSKIQAAKIQTSAPPKFNHSVVEPVSRLSHDSLLEKLNLLSLGDNKSKLPAVPQYGNPGKLTTASAPSQKPNAMSWTQKLCCSSCISIDSTYDEEEPPRPYRPQASAYPADRPVTPPASLPLSESSGSRIPPLSPKTAASLAKLMDSPPSSKDKPGYIYIFRHTPDLEEAGNARSFSQKGKLLLKIGRAENVHERMNQWRRQCQSPVQLLRYYPQADQIVAPRQGLIIHDSTPHAKKVEARIHLELRECHAKLDACPGCSQIHSEWFWIDESKEGVHELDLLIRRCIAWDYEMTAQNADWRENKDSAKLVRDDEIKS